MAANQITAQVRAKFRTDYVILQKIKNRSAVQDKQMRYIEERYIN